VGEQECRQMRIEYYVEFGESINSYRLRGIEKFEGDRENFIFSMFIYFKYQLFGDCFAQTRM